MARSFFLVLFAVATLLHGSAAQTRHVVGDSTGWTIPSGGAATYTAWASGKTFVVGDTLVFNFTNGQHDVAKVTKSAYDACNGASTIFTLLSGPATVTLNETGEQYYICTFGSHCSLGQKLTVNVVNRASATPSPAPQPSRSGSPPTASPVPAPTQAPSTVPAPAPAPSTVPAPAPGPSTGPVTFTVGDNLGWTVPTNGAAAYTSWASGKTFRIGDVLVFNYQSNAHNVEELTKEDYDSCNSSSPLATYTTPPARVTLNKTGAHYFICGVPGHCLGGQKLAINVTGSGSTANSPSPVATPPSPSSPSTNPSTPSPSGSLAPPPQNSGAASLGLVGVSATLLSLAAAFFY
ncbi:blue copper protein [Vigna radiata var. radiata]|uniref:Blue copper protein n=1 Tax=Vigna radiata var. radiata TaxID=3916 RepID=A0A1S3UMC5_VIGRR|nr:blue copper protein [Vigna radiata var. radiata]